MKKKSTKFLQTLTLPVLLAMGSYAYSDEPCTPNPTESTWATVAYPDFEGMNINLGSSFGFSHYYLVLSQENNCRFDVRENLAIRRS